MAHVAGVKLSAAGLKMEPYLPIAEEQLAHPNRSQPLRVFLATLTGWLLVSGALHLTWELLHVRLYTLWFEASAWRIVYSVLHCTAGDVLISAAAFLAAATATRDGDWPRHAWRIGLPIVLVVGVGYTAVSEWINVYHLKRWAYAPQMPLIGGIGVTPLLQWIVVPIATLWIRRRRSVLRRGVGHTT